MKRLLSLFAALMLLMLLTLPAHAQTIDPERKGSITAVIAYQGEPVAGGSLTLYRVASLHPNDEVMLRFTPQFADCGISLDDLGFDTAVQLATYVFHNDLPGLTKEIGSDGRVCFEALEVGLYLLIQWEPAAGFYELSPYLLSIPKYEDGVYVYDIESAPKQTPDERPTEEPGTEPGTQPPADKPTEPPVQPGEKLPQTGLTNWPIPLLAVCGAFLVIVGLVMVAKGRRSP